MTDPRGEAVFAAPARATPVTYNVLVAGDATSPRNAVAGHINATSNARANTVPTCGAVSGAISRADKEFDAVFVDAEDSSAHSALVEVTDIHGVPAGVYTDGSFLTHPDGYSSAGAAVHIHDPDDREPVLKALDHLVTADGALRATVIHPDDPNKVSRTAYGDPVLLDPPHAFFLDADAVPDWARHGAEVVVADEAGNVRLSTRATQLVKTNGWIQYGSTT